jgi:hypothetical protein
MAGDDRSTPAARALSSTAGDEAPVGMRQRVAAGVAADTLARRAGGGLARLDVEEDPADR